MTEKRFFSLERVNRRIPFFLQHMLSFSVLMLAFFAVSLIISRQAQSIARQNYINERRYALETSAADFSQQLSEFRSVPLTMQRQSYYTRMRLLERGKATALHHYMMSHLQTDFTQQCSLLKLGRSFAFIYFRNSGAVLSKSRVSFSARDFFSDMVRIDEAEMGGDMLSLLESLGSTPMLVPAPGVTGSGIPHGNYLLFLFAPSTESTIYGLFIQAKEIDQLFRLNEMPQHTRLTLTDEKGKVLYASAGTDAQPYEAISLTMPFFAAEVRIPLRYFQEMTAPLTAANRAYLWGMLAVGLLLSLLFSHLFQRPVEKLLRIFRPGARSRAGNEFALITRGIEQADAERKRLHSQIKDSQRRLRQSLLARLLAQDAYSDGDDAFVAEHLPQLSRPARILCLQLVTGEDTNRPSDFILFHVLNNVDALFGEDCQAVQMRNDLVAVLLPEGPDCLARAAEAIQSLQEDLNIHGVSLAAGASEAFSSAGEIHMAYLHALFSIQYFISSLSVFEPARETEPFRFSDLQKYQNAVLACDGDAARQTLDALLGCAGRDPWVLKALGFILEAVCADMHLPAPSAAGSGANFLRRETDRVLQALTARKNQYADTLFSSILQYLEEQYADPSLSNDSIASRFGISKSYLHHMFREAISMTPSDKLESIRIGHASRLLSSTRLSINEIAAACGYNSANTFYKAYKKLHGISPSAGRALD